MRYHGRTLPIPAIFTDFRKTALLAGIAIILSAVWSFVAQLLTIPLHSTPDLITMAMLLLLILLLELPTPIFLILLYRTGIRPSLSRNLQSVVMALTAILGLSLLLFIRDEWRVGIFPDTRALASSARFGAWFLVSPGSPLWTVIRLISTALHLASRLLTIAFFVAFATQIAPSAAPATAETARLKKAALWAVAARVLGVMFSVLSYLFYTHSVRTYGNMKTTPGVSPVLRDLLFALPTLILPWIVYRYLRKHFVSAQLTSA